MATSLNRALSKVGLPAVPQDELSAAFPQGDGNFPAVFTGLFLDVVGMYGWSDVNVNRSAPGEPVLSPQYRACAADGYGNERYSGICSYSESTEVKGHQARYAGKGAFGKKHQCMSRL